MTDACDITHRPPPPDQNPSEEEIGRLIKESKTIAVVGLSNKPHRESYLVGKYLRDNGYEIIPVHPNISEWEGLKVYKRLSDIPGRVDIVDIFRRADAIGEMTDEIIAKKPKAAWLQLGIVNNEAAAKLRDAGMTVVQDRCLKVEHMARRRG